MACNSVAFFLAHGKIRASPNLLVSSVASGERPIFTGDFDLKPVNTQISWTKPPLLELQQKKSVGSGKFGSYGGRFVPETLITSLNMLEAEVNLALNDPEFQSELATALKEYVGRETPLYYAQRLSNHYKNGNGQGPDIYIKREDLNHGGSYKMNNALAQAMIAKRMGLNAVVAATGGGGHHGLATAAACAKLSLGCTILMGSLDMERHPSSVLKMRMLGAEVKAVVGSFKEASSEAMRHWVTKLETSYFLVGTAVGPHPCPSMVGEFQSVIGKEVRKQAMEKWGGKPHVLVACVGSGSNAIGLFHEFVKDKDVRLIGVEAGGSSLSSGKHSATLAKGDVGVYHGAKSYLLQDDEGQILGTHSIAGGLEYAGVSPELSFLKDMVRVEIQIVTDKEAVEAYQRLCRLEGIFPSLEASHALAILEKMCPTLPDGTKVVVNCSGSGEDDVAAVFKYKQESTDK